MSVGSLCLSRYASKQINIRNRAGKIVLTISVVSVKNQQARLKFKCDSSLQIYREEIDPHVVPGKDNYNDAYFISLD